MKKLIYLPLLALLASGLSGCGDNSKVICVGATPSPHSEILSCSAVKTYVESKGYTLKVKVYQDYITPNKALNDGNLDANYFQHIPYLETEISEKGYSLSAAAKIHYEPLNLYGKEKITDFTDKKISVVNDASNVERAYALLKDNGIIDSYDIENFDAQHPSYTSSIGVTIECLDPGLLSNIVNYDGLAVIPGNYALTAWGSSKASEYKILGESEEVAGKKANVIAVKTSALHSEKTNVLVEALAQSEVEEFIQDQYGPTVVYSFEDIR